MDNHSKDSNMGKRQTNNTNTVNRTILTVVQIKNWMFIGVCGFVCMWKRMCARESVLVSRKIYGGNK